MAAVVTAGSGEPVREDSAAEVGPELLLDPRRDAVTQGIGLRGLLLPVGPALYRIGLTFSVGLALFPLLIMMISWVVSGVGRLF